MGLMHPTKSKQDLRVFWKPANPQECVWKNLYQNIMRTISQEKGTLHCSITIWYTKFSCASGHEDTRSKSSSGKGMGKLEKISAWNLTKVRSKKEVIDEARTNGAKVHIASLMDICHLKNAELEQSTKNTKVRLYSEVIL